MVHTLKHIALLACFVALIAFSLTSAKASEDDKMVLDNAEELVRYGIDSTGSWWAITKPFDRSVSLYINGQRFGPYSSVAKPQFSADGSTWIFSFVRELQTYVRTPSSEQQFPAEWIDGVSFASQTTVPWIEYTVADTRTITDGTRTYTTTGAIGRGLFDPTGAVYWHAARRGTQVALVRNGVDKEVYDDVVLAGIWSDARPVYAARNGSSWSVFIGDQEIGSTLQSVNNLTVNAFGTVLAYYATRVSSPLTAYMYTDDYRNTWAGPNLDNARDLVLSPCCDLIAVTGTLPGGARVVLFNSAAYPAGAESSLPAFSFDGEHMAFIGNDGDGFVSMDGRRHTIRSGGVAVSSRVAVSPSGRSVAWVSRSTLAVYNIDSERMSLGKMCDTMGSDVIYNRRTSEYQALGVYGGRLFLLSTPAP